MFGGLRQEIGADRRAVQQLTGLVLAGLVCIIGVVAFLIMASVHAVQTIDKMALERERGQVERYMATLPGGLNEITLDAMAATLDLPNARIVSGNQFAPGDIAVAVSEGSDRMVSWTPHRFGTIAFETIAPLRIAAGLVFVLVAGLIGWRVNRLGRSLDRSRVEAAERALTDPLTGLGNRMAFDTALEARYTALREGGPDFALLMIDLDGLKAINDINGHAAGDIVLRAAADVLRQLAGPDEQLARIGGDEFAVLRPASGIDAYLGTLMERLITTVPYEGRLLKIGASAGLAHSSDYASATRLSAAADAALYRAKRNGGHSAERAIPALPRRVAA